MYLKAGFFKFVVTPLITEWHRFLQNDLSAQMLKNLLYNQNMWETLLAEELLEETGTEISDADLVDDDIDTSSVTNVSDSSELLLPLRRSSLNPAKPTGIKEHLRRFSVPLNVFQDTKFKNRDKRGSSAADHSQSHGSQNGSEHSLHSQLSIRGQCDLASTSAERVLSTENLLPDSSIALITTPVQATRLNTVLKHGAIWKLVRQQTFPPLEGTPRPYEMSNEDPLPSRFRSETVLKFDTSKKESRFSNLFKRSDTGRSEGEDSQGSRTESNSEVPEAPRNLEKENLDPFVKPTRRESVGVGSQLRDNITSVQLSVFTSDQLLRRRKSMPTDAITYSKFS